MNRFLTLAVILGMATVLNAADPPAAEKKKGGGPFGDLAGALKASPGCLGVESARTSSGKQVIFAWFENKKAAMTWYLSDFHQDLMQKFFPNEKSDRKPLADVIDETAPILAIASVTFHEKPAEGQSPFKRIAIELYQPLGGGLDFGGKFAPAKMKVPERKGHGK
jgi:heme-degrading monooxygenase HmoA